MVIALSCSSSMRLYKAVVSERPLCYFLDTYTIMAATNLAGVQRIIKPHLRLRSIYKKILRLTEKIPPKAAYKINTEEIISYRLSIVNHTEDPKEIEKLILGGNIEMLISQAQAEYELCQQMLVWKCWEPLKDPPPPGQWRWPIPLQ